MKNRIFGSFEDNAASLRRCLLTEDTLVCVDHAKSLGSRPMSTSVRMCMDSLRGHGIALDDYTGPAEDIACDLLTAEACITALAAKILEHQTIPADLRELADRPLLQNNCWLLPDGHAFDLAAIPLLRDYARQIDHLREACAQALG